ncbi:MAG: 5-oxoprolinase subunit PxpA [Verrucomicrobia bacterium]|nr:5-oxoprolinase subunit PxpA [Verrucomicrobiota bacterium]
MRKRIDLNCDMGESFGLYSYGADAEIIPHISSANIACGFHAGDPSVMRKTVRLALDHGVAIGAHVGFSDLRGFGRRLFGVCPSDLKDDVAYQIGALAAFARAAGASLHHVKPHGALYMMAIEERKLSRAMVEAALEFDEDLMIYAIRGSETDHEATRLGLRVVPEFFADRGYHSSGKVKMFDWKISEAGGLPQAIGKRVVRLLREGSVASIEGEDVSVQAETVCVHSDTPGSSRIAQAIRQALHRAGFEIKKP